MVGLRRGVVSQQKDFGRARKSGKLAHGMVLLIFGLGSAGLPLRLQHARSGIRVLGLDIAAKNFPRYRRSQPHPASSRL
jgi:UDP-N-acetyl-D-mannosaminuronate dehydrogenase